MRKLGLVAGTKIATGDFKAYIRTFKEGLSDNQSRLIAGLFMQQEGVQPSEDD
jgi:hypothetical protein